VWDRPNSRVSRGRAGQFGNLASAGIAHACVCVRKSRGRCPRSHAGSERVYGVLQNYNWQAYAGYTHFTFYEIPGVTGNLNGFNMSLVFYPHGGHIGADGEFAAAFAPEAGVNTTMALGMGGARYRVDAGHGIELWAHGLVGGAHFTPQTAYGSTNAFAFEVGGGVDLNPRHGRLGYRAQVDMVGTRFFGTHQYNPKISLGIVYKF
jgi:hypothetical protein